MSLFSLRNSLQFSRFFSSRVLLTNSISKTLSTVGHQNTRTITRSLFFMSRNRYSDPIASVSNKLAIFNTCNCGLHTKGDQELAAFLGDEIENEKKSQASKEVMQLEGFQCTFSGADVTLTKKLENETIIIKSNVNNSVDAEETVVDPNETTKEPEEPEMKAKPEFTVEIKKGKKTLSFLCSYSQPMPEEEEAEPYNDAFQITEVSLYEDDFDDSTYTVSGDIMDGYLYDLLMNYLEERGISNDFADKMMGFFTAYEHKLYLSLLHGMKTFIEK